MKRVKLCVLFALLALAWFASGDDRAARALSRGPFLERTAAPGEETCNACHRTYPLDSGPGSVEILDLPERYAPATLYPIRVRVADPIASQWGFEITAIDEEGAAAGFFQTSTETVLAVGPSQRYGRFYAHQTLSGTYPGLRVAAEWTFFWKSPATDLGPVTLYAAGNAANGDHTDFFDYVYTTNATVDGQRRNVRVILRTLDDGERIGAGETTTIRWEATDGDTATPASFRVLLSTDGGETYPTVIADGLPATARAVAWAVPDALATTSARVRVVALDSEGNERGDASRADLTIGPLGLDRRNVALALPAGAVARMTRWADATGDGRADVAVVAEPGGARVYVQLPDGGFVDRTDASGLGAAPDARVAAWGDYDGDGVVDLALMTDLAVLIYHNDGQGVFSLVGAPTLSGSTFNFTDGAWTDVDGDGLTDLVAVVAFRLVVVRNLGGGSFEEAPASWTAPRGDFTTLAVGPAIAAGGGGGVSIYRFASGRFKEISRFQLSGDEARSLAWADVTGDGLLDVVGAVVGSGVRGWAAAGGGGRYEELGELAGLTEQMDSVAAGDYDADGRVDLIVSGAASTPRVLHGVAGGFEDVSHRFALTGGEAPAWVDLDGSGLTDLVAFAGDEGEVLVNPRSDANVLRVRPTIAGRLAVGAVVRVDLDGDGDVTVGRGTARALDAGAAEIVVAAPGLASARVRVEFPATGGREVVVATGGAAADVTRPDAPVITAVDAKTNKIVVTGAGVGVSSARLEVGGVVLARVKAPARFAGARLVGRDPRLSSLFDVGFAVVVVDPATGILSAPYLAP